jgi:hypothetical protein
MSGDRPSADATVTGIVHALLLAMSVRIRTKANPAGAYVPADDTEDTMSVAATRHRTARKPVFTKPVTVKREPEKRVPQGLCRTCGHAPDCGYIRNSEQPVVFCEEFDSSTLPMAEDTQPEASAPTAADMRLWDEYKGLCMNCDTRETCAIRKPETGIWHCEEYK